MGDVSEESGLLWILLVICRDRHVRIAATETGLLLWAFLAGAIGVCILLRAKSAAK